MFGRSRKSIEFLMDWQIADSLMRIITEARRQLTLVSPYNRHWGHLKRELEAAQNRGVNVIMYYRSDEANPVADYDGIDGIPVRMLHSKIYSNEKTTLLTTMNLLETSAAYSREVGLLIRDADLRREIDAYIKTLTDGRSQIPRTNRTATTATPGNNRQALASQQVNAPEASNTNEIVAFLDNLGFCIECREPKPMDRTKPLCLDCFKSFRTRGKHKHCHQCGDSAATEINQPFCATCSDARLSGGAQHPVPQ